MSSNYEREIAAQNLEWFAKIKEGDRRVIEQLYNRIIEAEKFVRRLIVSFSEIGRAHVCTPVTIFHLVCRLLL